MKNIEIDLIINNHLLKDFYPSTKHHDILEITYKEFVTRLDDDIINIEI